ncbi:hypothetical protein FYU54_16000 [Salmonella enterica subsp. enterica]|nr:hypothetical protein [Salmonella enterica subsp. enterica serovar Ohio]EDC3890215.1 hypothetical protein [Salmonella enterica subsp. enterica serovar Livingstone]ECD6145656.1 hypothetical protein [Salmonella enterica subsp. enterica serovar Ohio]ECO2233387.1 hypothetical protein [Salmonella enterica subsp. enterica serovar Ohio]ECQ1064594.1 hypothetical protein [Salmonella enterica subsp. enterica serovar Ohio]
MPVVPTTSGRQVQSRGVSTQGFTAFQTPNMGEVIGGVAEQYAGVLAQAKQRANVAMAQDACLSLSQISSDLLNNPETGLLNLKGKNAIGKGEEYTQQFDSQVEQLAMTLPDDQSRNAFMQQAQQYRVQFTTQAGRHEIGQINAYEEGQFQATLLNNGKNAAALYGDNAAYTSVNVQTFQQIEDYGVAHGWSDEQIQAKKTEFKEKVADSALSHWSANNAVHFIQSNGELSDTAIGSRRAVSDGSPGDAARGIRNNNPGNLEYSKTNPWVGQTGDDGRFAKFETPEHGIRALGRNLLSYQRQGIDTVSDIINRWAPPQDNNNTDAYIKAVCEQLGVTPDQQLDASNPDTLKALCAAIIHHENGSQPYSDQQLSTGVSAAIGLSSLPTSTKRYTGNAAFDAASPEAQATFMRQADQIRKQQQAEYRTGIDSRVRDATAAYMRGVDFPDAPSQNDFLAAYGVREGNLRYTEFRNTQIAGQYIGSFRNMPTSSITAYVEQLRPGTEETGEGYASRAELFDQVSAAATKVITQRQNNPFNAAVEIGAYKPIASNNPNDITAEVANRFSSQESLRALGINAPILNSEEAAALAQQVRGTQNVDQTIKLLQSMGETLPAPAMRQVASAIAPSSAATAYSALLLGTPDNQYDNTKPTIAYSQFIGYKPTMNKYDVSKVILAGDQLLNPTKAMKDAGINPVQLPSEDKLKRAFDDQVGNAFANNPQARQLSYSLFKSAYAGIAYQSGDSAMTRTDAANSDVVEKAAQYATGGVYKGFNGGDVVMPFGMDKSTFKDRYTVAAQQALKDAGLNENAASNFTPVNIGNNQYRLVSGSGRWATDPSTREPIVVRVE